MMQLKCWKKKYRTEEKEKKEMGLEDKIKTRD